MFQFNNNLIEIKNLLQQLSAKQEAMELEQKQSLKVIFKIARDELLTVKKENDTQENNIVLAVRDLLCTTKALPQVIVEQIRSQCTQSMVYTTQEIKIDMHKAIGKITIQLQDIIKEIK